MATRTQATLSILLAVGASVLAGTAAHSALAASDTEYSGVITASSVTPLNFQAQGYIDAVNVQPGETVHPGQVLATQNSVLAQSQLTAAQVSLTDDQATAAADQAAVTADQARVDQFMAPQESKAQAAQGALTVAKAQLQLQQAQQTATDTAAVSTQSLAQANSVLKGDQTQLATDTATLAQACPTAQPAFFQAGRCDTLNALVSKDQLSITDQQGLISVLQASAARSASQTAGAVALAQTNVELARSAVTVADAPADAATIAEAQAALARDQAQVQRDNAQVSRNQQSIQSAQLALAQLQLTAPTAGVVVAVGGQVGELAASTGVRQYGSQVVAGGSQSTPLFSLLPAQPATDGATTSTAGEQPLIEIRAVNGWQVTLREPETVLGHFTQGRAATVSIAAANVSNLKASEAEVSPVPVVAGGVTNYEIHFTVSGDLPPTVLSGMTADVRLS